MRVGAVALQARDYSQSPAEPPWFLADPFVRGGRMPLLSGASHLRYRLAATPIRRFRKRVGRFRTRTRSCYEPVRDPLRWTGHNSVAVRAR